MQVAWSRGHPDRVVGQGEALAVPLGQLFSAVVSAPAPLMRRLAHLESTSGHVWSAEDVLMVIVWVLILPHAATRFEHYILVPPFANLPAVGAYFVAYAATLGELTVGAMLARIFAAIIRKILRSVVHRAARYRENIRHKEYPPMIANVLWMMPRGTC